MAKGSDRKRRLAVLEELESHDAAWAARIRDLQAVNPQAYRKAILKADVFLSAFTGRKLTLSMRPRRFGGDEDPILVRRVEALRKAYPELLRGVDAAVVLGRPTPDFSDVDLGSVEGWRQHRTPAAETPDLGAVDGWTQERSPEYDSPDLGPVEGWTQHPSPAAETSDLGAVEGWQQAHTPPAGTTAPGPAAGSPLRGRAPELVPRPADASPTHALPDVDLGVLEGSVASVRKALESGTLDAHLDALETAERAGKSRKGVLSAIAARR